jgi:hypothetical protein
MEHTLFSCPGAARGGRKKLGDLGRLPIMLCGLAKRARIIRRDTFRSAKVPTNAIGRFIDAYNDRCQAINLDKRRRRTHRQIIPSKS